MTIHPRGLLAVTAFGVALWLAADLRWAFAALVATALVHCAELAGLTGLGRKR